MQERARRLPPVLKTWVGWFLRAGYVARYLSCAGRKLPGDVHEAWVLTRVLSHAGADNSVRLPS